MAREANRLVLDAAESDVRGAVDEASSMLGTVILADSATVRRSVIRGPAIIGAGTVIEDGYIGPFTSIGENCRVSNSEVEYSIVCDQCEILEVNLRIEGSLLGNEVQIVRADGLPRTHRFMIGDQSRVEIL